MPSETTAARSEAPGAVRSDEARAAWQAHLSRELSTAVRVSWNRARSEPVRWRWSATGRGGRIGEIELKLHERFAEGDPALRDAMASWIRSGKRAPRACALIDRWIAEHIATLPARPRRLELRTRGACHDLGPMARELFEAWFRDDFRAGSRAPEITWGRQARSRSRGALRLGSFDSDGNLVRIHPVLDQPLVPDWFVRYVLFHEILHAALPPRRGPGQRWVHHGPEFRRREERYPDYPRALAWEERHLGRLIRAARRRPPRDVEPKAPLGLAASVRALAQGLLFDR